MLNRRAFTAGAAFALMATAARADDETPVKIGFHAGLTGPAAADGFSGDIALNLAIDEANKAGGINGRRLQLVQYDDQGKAGAGRCRLPIN